MKRLCAIAIITWLSGLVSCTQSDSLYYHIPARLVVENVYQAQALYTACNSMGEFCSVTMDAKKIYIQGSKENSELVRTAIGSNYDNTILGLGGLIIGLPSLPEIGKDVSQVVCFDLNCPNCYEQYGGISKRMELSGTTSRCRSCNRTYDLNSMGIVSSGEGGRALFRYKVSYVGTALVVSNR